MKGGSGDACARPGGAVWRRDGVRGKTARRHTETRCQGPWVPLNPKETGLGRKSTKSRADEERSDGRWERHRRRGPVAGEKEGKTPSSPQQLEDVGERKAKEHSLGAKEQERRKQGPGWLTR